MTFSELLSSAFGGGGLGVVGSLLGEVIHIFRAKQELREKIELGKLDIERDRVRGEVVSIEKAGELEVEREKSFGKSVEADLKANDGYRWVTAYKAATRPNLTNLLLILSAIVYFTVGDPETRNWIAESIVTLGATAVSWWFGSRQLDRRRTAKP